MVDDVLKTIATEKLPATRGPKPSKELIASIRSYGLMSPIVIRKEAVTGNFVIVDGMRRLAAVREIGLPKVNVLLLNEHSVREAAELTLTMNHARSENPLAEVEALQELRHYDDDMIRSMTGISKAALSSRFAWGTVGPDVLEAYNDGRLSMSAVSELSRAPESVRETFRKIVQNGGKFTVPEVKAEVAALKPKPTAEQQRQKDLNSLYVDLDGVLLEIARIYAEADRLDIAEEYITSKLKEVVRPDKNQLSFSFDESGVGSLDDVPF